MADYVALQDGTGKLLLQSGDGLLLQAQAGGGGTPGAVFADHYRRQFEDHPMWLRQSTASQEILLGPFVDEADGKTAETALTIANTDIKLWFEGGTSESNKNSGGATHVAGGRYYAVLDATDTATVGKLEVNVHVAGALPVRRCYTVLAAAVYDVLTGSTAPATTGNLTSSTVGTVTTLTNDPTGVGTLLTRLGTPSNLGSGATVAANLVDIESQTDDIGAAGAGLTAVPWNAAWDAEVQSECADALAVYDPPTKAELDAAVANVSVDEIQATALADLFNTDSGTTYASAVAGSVVKEIADNAGGSALTAAAIADAVWDEATAGHTTAGTFGEQLKTDVDAILDDTGTAGVVVASLANNSVTAAALAADAGTEIGTAVWATGTRSLTTLAGLTADANVTQWLGSAVAAVTAAGVPKVDVARVDGDDLTPTQLAQLGQDYANTAFDGGVGVTVWSNGTRTLTSLSGNAADVRSAVGLASANLDTQLAAIDDYLDTEVAAIKAKTDNLPAAPAAVGDIPTVSDIWTTALTEAYRATGATGTAAQLLYEIIAHLGESGISGTTKTLRKLDGSTTAKTYTLDSATTPTSITEAT